MKHIPSWLKTLFAVFLIWGSWKFFIYLVGEQNDPMEERVLPALAQPWEDLNRFIRIRLISVCIEVLKWLGENAHRGTSKTMTIAIDNLPGWLVGNYCLGLQLTYYYFMLMLIAPINWQWRIITGVAGVFLVQALNVFRIVSLCLIQKYYPSLAVLSHDYIYSALVAGCLLLVYWRIVSKYGR